MWKIFFSIVFWQKKLDYGTYKKSDYGTNKKASLEGRLSGDGVAVLGFPECLLDGLLTAAPGPLAIVRAAALGPEILTYNLTLK